MDDTDSYHEATDDKLPDDNRTAMGAIKSYRKTPFSSRYFSRASITTTAIDGGDAHKMAASSIGDRDEHKLLPQDLFARLLTDPMFGLSAAQVHAQIELYGPNDILMAARIPAWLRFAKNLFGGTSLILWAGVLMCFTNFSIQAGQMNQPPLENVYLGLVLLFVIVSSGLISFVQETHTTHLLHNFDKFIPLSAQVIRDGEIQQVLASELVVGDVVLIQSGDVVPADCRIFENENMVVDLSSLTGQSEPQDCDVQFTHESYTLSRNMIFCSTHIVKGSCKAVVIATGANTVIGQMATLAADTPRNDTLLSQEVALIVHLATCLAIGMGGLFFVISFMLGYFWIDAILFSIGIIVANVPESLLAVVTISMTLSARRLAGRSVVVKNLAAVEALASASIILCDKTGTLTQNRPTVAHIWIDNFIGEIDTSNVESSPIVSFDLNSSTWKNIARCGILCSKSEYLVDGEVSGMPIESAIFRCIDSIEGNTQAFRDIHPIVAEIPFNSIVKFQLSIHQCPDYHTAGYLTVVIGEPETVLGRCASALVDGRERPIDDDYRAAFRFACAELGGLGERLVALSDMRLSHSKFPPDFVFDSININFPLSGFRLLGVMSLIDPPRPNVPDAVAKCQAAGIKVIMITGDHPSTSKAIAKSVGILSPDQNPEPYSAMTPSAISNTSCLITGEEMNDMKSKEFDAALVHHQEVILAGFSSEQKLVVVESCQRMGVVVAVTGDGINDACALHFADVGIAMGGHLASDSAKNAADVILLDDNFASIVLAVEEGRIMFDNVKKIVFYSLCSNVPAISAFVLFLVAQIPVPLGALTVLCIDLGTDVLPAVSLAYEGEEFEHDVMARGPRNPVTEGLLDERMLFMAYGQIGLIQASSGLFTYFVIMAENGFWPSRLLGLRSQWDSRAINDLEDSYDQEWSYDDRKRLEFSCHAGFFFSVVLVQWVTLLSARTRQLSVFQRGMRANAVLNFALIFETILAFLLIYLPGLNSGLQMQMLSPLSWLPAIPFMLFLFAFEEIRKAIIRKHSDGWTRRETCF